MNKSAADLRAEAWELSNIADFIERYGYKYDDETKRIHGLPISLATTFSVDHACGCCRGRLLRAHLSAVIGGRHVYVSDHIHIGRELEFGTGYVPLDLSVCGVSAPLRHAIEHYLEVHPPVEDFDEDA